MIIKKRWTDNELQYLKKSYPNPKLSMKNICENLKRSKKSVEHKAGRLNLIWKYKNKIITIHKRDPKYDLKWYYDNKDKVINKRRLRDTKMNEEWLEFKSTLKCEICLENHPSVLEFHHTDPSKKEGNIAQMRRRIGWKNFKKLTDEIKKCKILCSNHHKILHWNEKNTILK